MKAARFSLRHRAKSRSMRSDIAPFLARIWATETMSLGTLANGFILGWSVGWPPGPINAEMIRRGLLPKERGGGFWGAWPIGLGACTGDFLWAFCVSLGAGCATQFDRDPARARHREPGFASVFGGEICSWCLADLPDTPLDRPRYHAGADGKAWRFFRRAAHRAVESMERWLLARRNRESANANDGRAPIPGYRGGGRTWCVDRDRRTLFSRETGCTPFARPEWQIATEAITAAVMAWFAIRLFLRFP